jgi:hypothetical protein
MTTTTNFKTGLDLPLWRPLAPPLAADTAGMALAWDHRNDTSRLPVMYMLRGTATFDMYSPIVDDWIPLATPSLSGVAAGSTAVYHPSQGPRGTLAASTSTTQVVLSTALPSAVGVNQLADSGDGTGHRIRIIGKSASGSGKINSRNIIANTAGTTPTITVDVALDWTPASGDAYEIHSGRVFLLGSGAVGASSWKYYDIATNSYSAGLTTTNLPGTIATDSNAIAMSELHVSCDRMPGTGFLSGGSSYDPNGTGLNGALATPKNCILATASSSTTITGSGMPSDLQANEYVNFQVRIVEDTTTPTSVGQRSLITSHTAGATAIFTVSAWGVTPSSTAKFVVENYDDWILLRSSASTSVYTYSCSGNTWSTSTFGASGSAVGAGVIFEQCFGIVRDTTHNRRHSHLFCIRGGNSNAIDMLDIAAASTGTWSNSITYGFQSQAFTTGTTGAYDPVTLGGKYLHLCVNGTSHMARFNMLGQTMEAGTYLRYPQGAAVTGQKLALNFMMDGATKIALLHQKIQSGSQFFSNLIQV